MTFSKRLSSRIALVASVVLLLLSVGLAGGSTVKWTIGINDAAAGDVVWSTTSPPANGVIDRAGKLTFDVNSFVDLTFQAMPGYELQLVLKNGEDWTAFLDAQKHFRFGPVTSAHLIVVKFAPIVPTGSFAFNSPLGSPLVPSMVDVTGSYTGVTPTKYSRDYAVDVAMDEDGKLDVMGTVAGIEPDGGGEIAGGVGAISTVNGEPTARLKGGFSGTRDGVDATAQASGSGVVEVKDIGGGTAGVEGVGTYHCVAGGVPFDDKNVPVQAAVDPATAGNVRKAWSVRLDISKQVQVDGKPRIVASARVVLPNGDTIDFPQRNVRYSVKNGYSVALKKGTNVTRNPAVLDKKTKISIRKMTLMPSGPGWQPTGGSIDYKFLGQKGKASLLDFMAP